MDFEKYPYWVKKLPKMPFHAISCYFWLIHLDSGSTLKHQFDCHILVKRRLNKMPQQIPKYLKTKHCSKITEKDNLGRHESICGHYRASKIIETKLPVVIRFTKGYNCKLTKVFGIDDKNCVLCKNQDLRKNHRKAIQQIQGGCNIKVKKCDDPDQPKKTLKSKNGNNYQRGPKMTRYQC